MLQVINLTKHLAKVLRFIVSATSKDDARQVLKTVVCNNHYVATDGFRLHATETVDAETGLDGQYTFENLRSSGGKVIAEEDVEWEQFPDYSQIIPVDDPECEISLNAKYLYEALKPWATGEGEVVRLSFYGEARPFEVTGKIQTTVDGKDLTTKAYALIMPMHADHETRPWRPVA